MVPERVSPEYICRIVVYDEKAAENLVNEVQAAGTALNYPVECGDKTCLKYYVFF